MTIDGTKLKWWVLYTAALIIFLINVDFTAANLILAPMSSSLNISLSYAQWIITIYMIAFGALAIAGGKLGDIYGSNKILIIGTICFALASLLAGMAQNSWQILTARVIQGIGGALTLPNAMALSFKIFPYEQKGLPMGILNGAIGLALAAGPMFGGYITSILSWRYVFLINIPLCIPAIILAWILNKNFNKKSKSVLDIPGLIFLSLMLICIIFAMDLCKQFHAHLSLITFLTLLAIICFYSFNKTKNKKNTPIIDLAIFRNKKFALGCLIRTAITFTNCSLIFVMGIYLQKQLGFDILKSSYFFLPFTICMGLFAPLGGKISDYTNPLLITKYGIVAAIIAYIGFALITTHSNFGLLLALFALIGTSFGLGNTGAATITLLSVSDEKNGTATAIFTTLGTIGGTIGITICSIVLNYYYIMHDKLFLQHTLSTDMKINAAIMAIIFIIIIYKKSTAGI